MWRIDPKACAASFLVGLAGALAYVLLTRLAG